MMDWTLFEKILEDLKAFQGQISVINLHGFGEPLLNPRIADMVRALKESGCCREIRTTTNGSLLDSAVSESLISAGIDIVQISVEALSSEGYWELCGVQMEFAKIVRNVEAFHELAVRRGGACKVSAKIVSAAFRGPGDEAGFAEIFAPITDYYSIEDVEPIWSEFAEMQMPSVQVKAEGDRCCTQTQLEGRICSLPFTDMCIHSNGIVGACCSDWKFATQYGDVKENLYMIFGMAAATGSFCAVFWNSVPFPFALRACASLWIPLSIRRSWLIAFEKQWDKGK